MGDPRKRYYVRALPRGGAGPAEMALVEGVPDADKPHDPKRDTKDGPEVLRAPEAAFWAAVKAAGYTWVQSGFARHWAFGRGGGYVERQTEAWA